MTPIQKVRRAGIESADTTKRRLFLSLAAHYHVTEVTTVTMPYIDDGFEALLEPFYNGKKLTDPISTKEDKFQLLPAFLKVKGLVKQHIDSYNFFVDTEIKEIVRANRTIRSDVNSSFWLE